MMSKQVSRRVVFFAVLLSLLWPTVGSAQSWGGQVCWQLDSFSDRIRTGLLLMPDGQFNLTVKWSDSTGTWQFNGNGAASMDVSAPGTYRLSFSAAGNTANHSCALTASLSTATISGPWRFECRSGFTNAGSNMHIVACPAGDAPFMAPLGTDSMTSQSVPPPPK